MLRIPDPKSAGLAGAWRSGAGFSAILLLVLAIVLVCWPGIHGFWGRDDYSQLALVRLLDSPWVLFYQDHYILPGSVFRPLGFASMWLGTQLFGHEYPAHAMVDIGLHALVALSLYGVLRRAHIPRMAALPCTLLFALHPAVTGTAMWWSARFDLLSTLFVLLALQAAQTYCRRPRWQSLLFTALALLAAMLSKEIGLVGVAAVMAMYLYRAWRVPAWRKPAWRACSVAVLCAVVFLLWRWAVLGTLSSHLTGPLPMGEAIVRGLGVWARQMPGYLSFWNRLDLWQRVILAIAIAAVPAALLASRMGRLGDRQRELLLVGICLLLLPALLQAPVMAMNAVSLEVGYSSVETAMQSRLYYLGMAGLAMVVAAALSALWWRQARQARLVGVFAVLLAVLVFGTQAHVEVREFAQRSSAIAGVARAASRAVSRLDLPAAPCHVALVGIDPPPEWDVFVSVDSIIKALAPDLDRVDQCWFHSNYRTWFYLLRAPITVQDASPYHPRSRQGRQLPWRHVGNVVIALLDPASDSDPRNAQVVLRYKDGAFVRLARGNLVPR